MFFPFFQYNKEILLLNNVYTLFLLIFERQKNLLLAISVVWYEIV